MKKIQPLIERALEYIGSSVIASSEGVGTLGLFFWKVLQVLLRKGVSVRRIAQQMNHVGVNSLSVVFLTGTTVGGVLALHAYHGVHRFGADQFIGPLVYLSMTREFGSILSGIMVTARAGSAMTAEIGTMRITEQIDALRTIAINPYRYLIIPRIIGTTIILPFLSLFCVFAGVGAGYFVSVYVLKVNPEVYVDSIKQMLELSDITGGLVKSACFGFLCSLISCYKGFTTYGGSKGVGTATVDSVVYCSVTIFVANYLLSSFLFNQ